VRMLLVRPIEQQRQAMKNEISVIIETLCLIEQAITPMPTVPSPRIPVARVAPCAVPAPEALTPANRVPGNRVKARRTIGGDRSARLIGPRNSPSCARPDVLLGGQEWPGWTRAALPMTKGQLRERSARPKRSSTRYRARSDRGLAALLRRRPRPHSGALLPAPAPATVPWPAWSLPRPRLAGPSICPGITKRLRLDRLCGAVKGCRTAFRPARSPPAIAPEPRQNPAPPLPSPVRPRHRPPRPRGTRAP
jgi:hypothetical protein